MAKSAFGGFSEYVAKARAEKEAINCAKTVNASVPTPALPQRATAGRKKVRMERHLESRTIRGLLVLRLLAMVLEPLILPIVKNSNGIQLPNSSTKLGARTSEPLAHGVCSGSLVPQG